MEHKFVISAETDAAGNFLVSESIVDVAREEVTVELWLTLLSPSLMSAHCAIDVESGEGSRNLAKHFSIQQGKQLGLGEWTLTPATDRIKLTGRTDPRFEDGLLRFELLVETS